MIPPEATDLIDARAPLAPQSLCRRENIPAAAAFMVIGSGFFVGLAALVKAASDEATPMQAVLYRAVFSALPLLGILSAQRVTIRSPRWLLLLGRASIGFAALYCYLWAVSNIRLADVLALQQMAPIFVSLLAIVLLGERPRLSHYVLAGVCLAGALLVIRPTRGIASYGSAVALLSAVLSSGAYIAVRALTRTEPSSRIVFWFAWVSGLLALPVAIPGWHWLSLRANLLLVCAGLMATVAQLMMTAAYRRAPAHIASAFSYAAVPLAYLLGVLFWDERPDAIGTLGIALIVVGGVAVVVKQRPGSP